MADETVTINLVLEKDDAEKVLKTLPKDAKNSGTAAGKEYTKGLEGGLKSGVGRVKQSFSGLTTALAGVAASFGAALTIREFTAAAIRQEDAVNNLNASLRRIGDFSSATSQDLQDFASSLQEVTRFGDEAVLENLSFAQSLGASAEQSKVVVAAAADLAAALGIDLQSATRNVAKTLGGYAGELGEVIPALKNLTTEQLRAGEGVELLAKQFNGFAQDEAATFGGSLDQLSNTIGDLFEEFGRFITRSETSAGALDDLKEAIQGLQTFARDVRLEIQEPTELDDVKTRLQSVKAEIIDLEQLQKTAGSQAANRFANVNENLAEKIRELRLEQTQLETKIKDVELAEKEALKRKKALADANNNQAKSIANLSAEEKKLRDQALAIGQSPLDKREEQLRKEQDLLDQANEQSLLKKEEFLVREQVLDDQFEAIKQQREKERLSASIAQAKSISQLTGNISDSFKVAAREIKVSALDIARVSLSVISTGVGRAFQNVGAALATGQNAFKAFADGLKSILADIASATGDLFIKQGVGYLFINPALGAGLIAAGAGLKVLAGFLGASGAGGGVGAAAGTTAAAGTPAFDFATGAFEQPEIDEERQTRSTVNVNVQGDVLDSDETGLRIVELINQGLERDGAIVLREA